MDMSNAHTTAIHPSILAYDDCGRTIYCRCATTPKRNSDDAKREAVAYLASLGIVVK